MDRAEQAEDRTLSGSVSSQRDVNNAMKEAAERGRQEDIELVVFSDDDPEDPKNWPSGKKAVAVGLLCILSFCGVFGSSVYAPSEMQVREMFGVNAEVASTGLTVYVLGFAVGPILCPMSEMYGRRLPYLISWPLLIAAIAPSAWANDISVIMIFRFLAGCVSSCALNNGSGFISDLYGSTPRKLQQATGLYAFCPLSGPIFGTIVGFFVAAHLTNGMWTLRVHWFFVIACLPIVFAIPETHGPTLLMRRAKELRRGGKTNAYAAHEMHTMTAGEQVWRNIGRPVSMLVREPINIGAAIWITLAYSIIYFFFECFPVVFVEQNHIPFELGGLPFLGITVGMVICVLTMDKATRLSKHVTIPFVDPPGGTPVDAPEAGLKVVLLSCALMPVSLFWFAWTSKGVHWISPTLSGVVFGYSMLSVFYAFVGYSAQTYKIYASSALAANTLARSIVASTLPIVAHPLLNNLGTDWGVSIFAFLSLGLIPIPVIFVRYGSQLRESSHFAQEVNRIITALRAHTDEKVRDIEDAEQGGMRDIEQGRPTDEKRRSSEGNAKRGVDHVHGEKMRGS